MHLGVISGQKIVIWLSTGFPDNEPSPPPDSTILLTPVRDAPGTSFLADIDDAVSALGNANIVLESAEASYIGASVSPENGPTATHINPLQMIAERTGGRFFPAESSDLATTIHKAAADNMSGYEVGFYDGGGWRPGLIPVEVRDKRAGDTLRYRDGYYAEPAAPQIADAPVQCRREGAHASSGWRSLGHQTHILDALRERRGRSGGRRSARFTRTHAHGGPARSRAARRNQSAVHGEGEGGRGDAESSGAR